MSPKASTATGGAGQKSVPLWAGFAWGLAESTAFFIVPDIILGWACLKGARAGVRMLLAILAGSVLGGLAMYGFADLNPERAHSFVDAVPMVQGSMFETVTHAYRDHGAVGMLYGPASGIPYKVYAVLAPLYFDPIMFAAMSVPARIERLALIWIGFTLAGLALGRWYAAYRRIALVFYCIFWVAVYAFYWSNL